MLKLSAVNCAKIKLLTIFSFFFPTISFMLSSFYHRLNAGTTWLSLLAVLHASYLLFSGFFSGFLLWNYYSKSLLPPRLWRSHFLLLHVDRKDLLVAYSGLDSSAVYPPPVVWTPPLFGDQTLLSICPSDCASSGSTSSSEHCLTTLLEIYSA